MEMRFLGGMVGVHWTGKVTTNACQWLLRIELGLLCWQSRELTSLQVHLQPDRQQYYSIIARETNKYAIKPFEDCTSSSAILQF